MSALVAVFVGIVSAKFHLREESGPGVVIGNVREMGVAVDRGNSFVALVMGSNDQLFADMIHVEPESGIIKTIKNFDREKLCPRERECELDLQIYVFSENRVEPESVHEAKLVVTDINDNSPYFEQKSYIMDIMENSPPGSLYSLPSAVDWDPRFGVEKYLLSPNDYFQIEFAAKPVMISRRPMDREEVDILKLELTAVDVGGRRGSAELVITVGDENDNKPVFPAENYSLFVRRGDFLEIPLNGKIYIGTVEAQDADVGENAEIRYSLGTNIPWYYRNHFEIDRNRGFLFLVKSAEISQSPLRLYELVVMANNVRQSLAMRTAVEVFVHVDVAEVDSLTILMRQKVDKITENGEIGQELADVAVFPPKSDHPGPADCFLNNSLFMLMFASKADQFVVLSSQVIDYEKNSVITTAIVCSHGKTKGNRIFTIHVADVNDNVPKFLHSAYRVTITENNQIGMYITTVSATDADRGSKISFWSNRSDVLAIGRQSGEIYAKISFDYESVTKYSVRLFARDDGDPPLTGTALLELSIADVNDHRPIFEEEYKFEVSNLNSSVGRVRATDLDGEQHNRVEYSILYKPGENGRFDINSTSGLIHYNTSQFLQIPELTELSVSARDSGGLCTSTTVDIYKVVVECKDGLCSHRRVNGGVFNSFIVTPAGIVISLLAVAVTLATIILLIKRPQLKTVVRFTKKGGKLERSHKIKLSQFELANHIEHIRATRDVG